MKLFFLLLASVSLLLSAPAFHAKKSFELEDGTYFEGYLKGDEHLNWIESDSGEILLFNTKSHRYEYAKIKDDALIPSGIAKSSTPKSQAILPHISKEELYQLWEFRRNSELQRRTQQ
jgi:hypothetical protein